MTERTEVSREVLKRRGLIAGAAALIAAAVAKITPKTAEAADGGNLIIGNNGNTAASATALTGGGSSAFTVTSSANTVGLKGTTASGGGIGTLGQVSSGNGLYGFATTGNAAFGETTNGNAFRGFSSAGNAVFGQSNSAAGTFGYSGSFVGARGVSDGQNGAGVQGECIAGIGVYGIGRDIAGVVGENKGSGPGGRFESVSGLGLYAKGPAGAAQFDGSVTINGSFTATGIKSAVVPHPDGVHRRVYCLESPESYFEDFGEANLTNGRAQVALDPEFAALVRTDDYQVFLTEYDDNHGLFVTRRGPRGFEVRAKDAATSGSFGYRVVAKREDIVAARLERVQLPSHQVDVPANLKDAPRPDLTNPPRPPGLPERQ